MPAPARPPRPTSTQPPRRRWRRPLGAALALAALGYGGLAAYWTWAAGQVERAIAAWAAEQRARGYDIAYGGPAIDGYPVRLAVRLSAPGIAAPEGWRWSGTAVTGEAAFWAPRTLRLGLPRTQTLSAEWRGLRRELTLAAAQARGRVTFGRAGALAAVRLEMAELTLTEQSSGGSLRAEALRYELTQRPPAGEGSLLARGEMRGIELPQAVRSPLGRNVQRLAFDATLLGPVPGGEPAAALAAWRDRGGRLEVRELALSWGPLTVHAAGTATLDARLRPQGAFEGRLRGLPETLDLLAAQGLLKPGVAAALKLSALTLAAKRDGDGATVVELPITLRDGLLFLGPVALFRLAPVL